MEEASAPKIAVVVAEAIAVKRWSTTTVVVLPLPPSALRVIGLRCDDWDATKDRGTFTLLGGHAEDRLHIAWAGRPSAFGDGWDNRWTLSAADVFEHGFVRKGCIELYLEDQTAEVEQ